MGQRVIIYTSDIQIITGKKYKPALALMHKIKKSLNKPLDAFITIDEFCIFTGLEREDVINTIKNA